MLKRIKKKKEMLRELLRCILKGYYNVKEGTYVRIYIHILKGTYI